MERTYTSRMDEENLVPIVWEPPERPDNEAGNYVELKEDAEEEVSTKRIMLAEFLSTYVMMLFGQGVCAQKTFSEAASCVAQGTHTGDSAAGSYLAINLGWGAGVFFGILIAGGVSGAHMNPAVTLTMAGMSPKVYPPPAPSHCIYHRVCPNLAFLSAPGSPWPSRLEIRTVLSGFSSHRSLLGFCDDIT